MFTRQLGSLVRGRISPVQMVLACVLGAMLGFLPGVLRAPGAVAALCLALLVLNAPLGLALAVAAGAKLLSLLALPLSFAAGRLLLDGPTQPLFRAAINAPVLALFGFEHYVVTGGLLLGAVTGLVAGLLVARGVRLMRLRLSAASADHAALAALAARPWARCLTFVLVGGGRRAVDWKELAELKGGRPFRLAGLVVAALFVGALFALHSVLTGPLLGAALKRGLTEANGATVDVGSASLDLGEGRLVIKGLALADPNALDHDVFRAAELTADVSGLDLLRRRVHLENVVIRDARQGAPRESPGSLQGWRASAPSPTPTEETAPGHRLEDYVRDYQLWRDRLSQAQRWLERLAPSDASTSADSDETLSERLQREADESGYADVVARHLVEGAPTLLVSTLRIDGLLCDALPGEALDVLAENLSTQPSLVDGAPHLQIKSTSGQIEAALGLGNLARRTGSAAAGDDRILFRLRAFPVDRIASELRVGGESPIAGGTMDVELDGHWSGSVGRLDLPLDVTLHDTTLRLGGGDAHVSQFTLPIGLRGPLDDLAISIDDEHLVEALRAAGAAELSRRVEAERDKLIEKANEKVGESIDGAVDKALDKAAEKGLGDTLGGLLGGQKKDKTKGGKSGKPTEKKDG